MTTTSEPTPFFALAGRLYTPSNRRNTKKIGFVTTPVGSYHIFYHPKFEYSISDDPIDLRRAVYCTLTNPRILSNNPNALIRTYVKLAGHEEDLVTSLRACYPQEQVDLVAQLNELSIQTSLQQHESSGSSGSSVGTPTEEPLVDTIMHDYLSLAKQPTQLRIAGLATEEGVYPRGNFAVAPEYEKYVALQVFGRTAEAVAHAAGLANAYVHLPRDPFPVGHCHLLMFKRDSWSSIYKRGQDYLTKEILEKNRANLDNERVLHYELRAGTQDAHLSLHKDRQNDQSVLIKVSVLAEKLTRAFSDGVVDFDEYDEIAYTTPQTYRQ